MATVYDTLKSLSAYPIPSDVLKDMAGRRGVDASLEATPERCATPAFQLAKADALMWLSNAPNISQGGISYSFSEDQRMSLRRQSADIYLEHRAADRPKKSIYGYKGSNF